MFLIQGFFFQDREWLDLGMGSEGTTVVVKSALCRSLFSGVIYPDQNSALASLVGVMNDVYGESVLSDVRILPEELSFVKKYNHRHSTIDYKFKRQGALWVGGYSGSTVGFGGAKCIITEAPLDLFKPCDFIE